MNGKKVEKLWIIYLLIMGIYAILEKTLLFPLVFILNKISSSFYITLKCFIHFWLYYPYYKGALFIECKLGKYIDTLFHRSNALGGKIFQKLGIPNRDSASINKKIE